MRPHYLRVAIALVAATGCSSAGQVADDAAAPLDTQAADITVPIDSYVAVDTASEPEEDTKSAADSSVSPDTYADAYGDVDPDAGDADVLVASDAGPFDTCTPWDVSDAIADAGPDAPNCKLRYITPVELTCAAGELCGFCPGGFCCMPANEGCAPLCGSVHCPAHASCEDGVCVHVMFAGGPLAPPDLPVA